MSESAPRPRLSEAADHALLADDGTRDGPGWLRSLLGGVAALALVGLGWALMQRTPRSAMIPDLIAQRLRETGVSNPVTGVLLNFRSYDTLLEVAVLVTAMAAVWSLDRGSRQFGRAPSEVSNQEVLDALLRLAVPLAFLTAVYLTWMGSSDPGGAFQAGSLLAGAGVLLAVSGVLRPPTAGSLTVRAAAASGVAVFVGVGVAVMPWTGSFMAYPEGWAYPLILGIEVLLTFSIAVVLVELFVDVPAVPDSDPSLAEVDPSGDPLGRALPSSLAAEDPGSGQEEEG